MTKVIIIIINIIQIFIQTKHKQTQQCFGKQKNKRFSQKHKRTKNQIANKTKRKNHKTKKKNNRLILLTQD